MHVQLSMQGQEAGKEDASVPFGSWIQQVLSTFLIFTINIDCLHTKALKQGTERVEWPADMCGMVDDERLLLLLLDPQFAELVARTEASMAGLLKRFPGLS
jgi:hypothetical protein